MQAAFGEKWLFDSNEGFAKLGILVVALLTSHLASGQFLLDMLDGFLLLAEYIVAVFLHKWSSA